MTQTQAETQRAEQNAGSPGAAGNAEVNVFPTLVVGVGGTGCKIAKRLKRTLYAEGGAAQNIRFVGVDTDLVENSARSAAELPLDCFLEIGGRAVNFDPADRTNRPMMHWLPTDDAGQLAVSEHKLGAGQGAGGKRLVGRFAYNYFAPDGFTALRRTLDELVSLLQNPFQSAGGVRFQYQPGIAVYVVSSLVGGTGSGAFLDVLATLHMMVDRVQRGFKRHFIGVFLLPSVFDYCAIGSQSTTHAATAYASLKDLDNLMSRDDPALRSFWYYNEAEPYQLKGSPLEACYLVDRYSGKGALLDDDDVYDMAATHLYAAIGTPLGAVSDSVLNNANTADVRDEQGGRRNYSAFGLLGVDYSQKLFQRYCGARAGRDALDLLIGGPASTIAAGVAVVGDAAPAVAPAQQAPRQAERFLAQLGLGGTGGGQAISYIVGDVGSTYVKPPETMENERTADLYEGLQTGLREFTEGLEHGPLLSALQRNYRYHLLSQPGETGQQDRFAEAIEPQMWRARLAQFVEETVRRDGLVAGVAAVEAVRLALERTAQEFETGIADIRANAQSAQSAFNDALEQVHGLTPLGQILRPQAAREAKRGAVAARNALVQLRVRAAAAELTRRVFNDTNDGLLPLADRALSSLTHALAVARTAREMLDRRTRSIEQGSRELDGTLGAPDRSGLIYDLVPPGSFPIMFGGLTPRAQQIADELTGGRSAAHLLDTAPTANQAEALAARACAAAEPQFRDLTDRHILDVLVAGAADDTERETKLREVLGAVAGKLSPFAPVTERQGEGKTYDYGIVLYPAHPDTHLSELFERVAKQELMARAHLTVGVIPGVGGENRIVLTYMMHGIPLNEKAFPEIARWMRAYENLRKRDPYLEVDRRWRKLPGPGQKGGDMRDRLFTLGLAYGLIAQQGGYFYSNFHRDLISHNARDASAGPERDQYEVDPAKLAQALHGVGSPREWFAHITQAPSAITTIPVHFGGALGTKKQQSERDRIAQGRGAAMDAFANDQGEDYADVADAIAVTLTEYVRQIGRAQAREELTWYRGALQEARDKTAGLREQYDREIDVLSACLEELDETGDLGLTTSA